jgi:hypothetical protein
LFSEEFCRLKNVPLSRSPYIEGSSEALSQDTCLPEIFPCGSTQAYQRVELDAKSFAVLEKLIEANNGKPITLSCGKRCFFFFFIPSDITFTTSSALRIVL